MKILGNGVDIVKNSRIKKAIKNEKFINKIYSLQEIKQSKKIKNKTNFFAKRFAAKEAFAKSLGTGFSKGINFKDISVLNKSSGKPILTINDKIRAIIKKKFKIKKFKVFLSLSDDIKYSIAFVILNKTK